MASGDGHEDTKREGDHECTAPRLSRLLKHGEVDEAWLFKPWDDIEAEVGRVKLKATAEAAGPYERPSIPDQGGSTSVVHLQHHGNTWAGRVLRMRGTASALPQSREIQRHARSSGQPPRRVPPATVVYSTMLNRRLSSEDSRLREELVYFQEFARGEEPALEPYWVSLPSRLGHNTLLDLSCQTFLTASHSLSGAPGGRSGTFGVTATLTRAIRASRVDLQEPQPDGASDNVIQSVALLASSDVVKGQGALLDAQHLEGLVATIASRTQGTASDISRSFLDYFSIDALPSSIAKGVMSPLEGVDREHYEARNATDPLAKLVLLRLELCIRLPGLIASVRAARTKIADGVGQSRKDTEALYKRISLLAKELYNVRDDSAELVSLQGVKVVKAVPVLHAYITNERFVFGSPLACETVFAYWHVRFWVIRLCLAVTNLSATSPSLSIRGLSRPTLEIKMTRVGQCLLMSAELTGPRKNRNRLRAQSMILLWGALKELPQIDLQYEDGSAYANRLAVLRDYLLEFTVRALRVPDLFSENDMDEAADMFVGGPPLVSYAQLYGGSKKAWVT